MTKRDGTTTALTPAERRIARTKEFKAKLATRTTSHWFTWRHVRCKITERPRYLGNNADTLLELRIIAARDTPMPITSTGFLAHFMAADDLQAAGGPVRFFADWMDREARSKSYQRAEFLWRQPPRPRPRSTPWRCNSLRTKRARGILGFDRSDMPSAAVPVRFALCYSP